MINRKANRRSGCYVCGVCNLLKIGIDGDGHGKEQMVQQVESNGYSNRIHEGIAYKHDYESDIFQGERSAFADVANETADLRC